MVVEKIALRKRTIDMPFIKSLIQIEKERAKVISILINIVMWRYKPTKEEIELILKYLKCFKEARG